MQLYGSMQKISTFKFMILLCDNNLNFECLIYAHSVGTVNIQVATL